MKEANSKVIPASQFADEMLKHAALTAAEIGAQREEILTAFVAKYGFQPDECQQIVRPDNSWLVVRIDPAEVREIRLNIILHKLATTKPTRWQKFCVWLAGL